MKLEIARSDIFIIAFSIAVVCVVFKYFPRYRLLTILLLNMLSQSNFVKSIIKRYCRSTSVRNTSHPNRGRFQKLADESRLEILSAIKSLQSSHNTSKDVNNRRRKLFSMMSWRQQKLSKDVGYLTKLSKIDRCIATNQILLSDIADYAVEYLGIDFHDFDMLKNVKNNAPSSNYRVIEALEHYLRDWSYIHETELKVLLEFIHKSLRHIIPEEEISNTCIVVPGSGLGRIAHEIALNRGYGSVHAVEYSGLMHVFNQFIYTSEKEYELYPYIYSCSNYTSIDSQFRNLFFKKGVSKPSNLHLHHEDFRYFEYPSEGIKNVVVVSAFFIDTAENMLDYMDKIKEITTTSSNQKIKNGYWINVGPLKYGSAAQVEFSAEEIVNLRAKLGWNDLEYINTIVHPDSYEMNGLVGYITDTKRMWQGYYGLDMWASQRKENERKIKKISAM